MITGRLASYSNQMIEQNYKLHGALRRIFRPIVRLMIGKGIHLALAIDLLKELYVEVAEEQITGSRKKLTDSHISVMTGVHRKDVKRLRAQQNENRDTAPPEMSAGAELLATWVGKKDYLNNDGKPLQLPYFSKDAKVRTFSVLAEEISKDISPRTLLDELERLGALSHDTLTGLVTLHSEAFLPKENTDNKIHYFGQNCGDHAEAAVANIFSDKPPFMDRSVYHNELAPESVDELQALAAEAGMKALRQVNRRAFELSERDKGKKDARHRLNFGVFFFREEETPGDGE